MSNVQENASELVKNGFSFVSGWESGMSIEFSAQIMLWNKAKPRQSYITLGTRMKIAFN